MKTFIKSTDTPIEEMAPGVTRQIMGYNSDLMLVLVNFKKGGIGANHSHPHQQVTYVESGVFEVNIEGKKEILRGGDAFVVPSNADHGVICMEDGVLVDSFSPLREDFIESKTS